MRIPDADFQRWLESVTPTGESRSTATVAERAGMSRSGLANQRAKDQVDLGVVIHYCRAIELDPVEQLRRLAGSDIPTKGERPAQDEILSQVPLLDLLGEASSRLRGDSPMRPISAAGPDAFARWIHSAVPRGGIDRISAELGMSKAQVSKKNAKNNWALGQLLRLCAVDGLNVLWGMATAGWVTYEEAGFPVHIREMTLDAATSDDLVRNLRRDLPYLKKALAQPCGSTGSW